MRKLCTVELKLVFFFPTCITSLKMLFLCKKVNNASNTYQSVFACIEFRMVL